MTISSHTPLREGTGNESPWSLVLFVARDSAPSAVAIVQLRRILAEYLPRNSRLEIVDLFEDPEVAEKEHILAIPTLVRKSPVPVRRIIGDMSDIPRVLASLGYPLE